jgi:hypothetical protein
MKLSTAKKRVKRAIRRCDGLAGRLRRLERKLERAYRKAEKAEAAYLLLKLEEIR